LDSNDAQEVIEIAAKRPNELKTAVRKAMEKENALEVNPYAKIVVAKAQLIAGDRKKAVGTLIELAETLTKPDQGKAKLHVLVMAKTMTIKFPTFGILNMPWIRLSAVAFCGVLCSASLASVTFATAAHSAE